MIGASMAALAPWILFVVLYVATFRLAWRMLGTLVVSAATGRHGVRSWRFWWEFVAYRFVILVPYLSFVVFRRQIPTSVARVVVWWVVLLAVLGTLRFVGTRRVVALLWWLYAYVYDGLLSFFPYRALIADVVDRLGTADGDTTLDLGCGTGNIVRAACGGPAGAIIGVDASASMLRKARRKIAQAGYADRVQFVHGDVLQYLRSAPADSINGIALVNVLYAVPDRPALWRECLRVLTPHGRVVATSSIEGGSGPIIREHLAHASWTELVSVRLVGVAVVDFFISELAKTGPFSFADAEALVTEAVEAGGVVTDVERTYGGPDHGVNVIFNVARASEASSEN